MTNKIEQQLKKQLESIQISNLKNKYLRYADLILKNKFKL